MTRIIHVSGAYISDCDIGIDISNTQNISHDIFLDRPRVSGAKCAIKIGNSSKEFIIPKELEKEVVDLSEKISMAGAGIEEITFLSQYVNQHLIGIRDWIAENGLDVSEVILSMAKLVFKSHN